MKNFFFILVLIFGVSSFLRSQAVFSSDCGYTVTVYIKPIQIIVPTSCEWGYNYNVKFKYDVIVTGNTSKCNGSNLYNFNVSTECINGQKNGGWNMPKKIESSSGVATTHMNPYVPHNGTRDGYNAPYVHCSSASVENFNCKEIYVTMEGPGLKILTLPVNPSPLPIELISFDAAVNQNQVNLSWITGSEKNNDFFTIERTVDGLSYDEIGKVEGQGNSSTKSTYSFTDYRPKSGVSYYRLKQTDYNGEFEYFDVKSVNIQKDELFSSVYPNPAVMNKATVFIERTNSIVTLNVRNLLGQLILSKDLDASLNDVTEEIELNESGKMFFVEITENNVIIARHKLMKD